MNPTTPNLKRIIAYSALTVAVTLFLLFAGAAGVKEYKRYQKRADAQNQVRVTEINVDKARQQARINYAQIEAIKAEAQKRREEAKGIRDAQDHIARTLTPLYVQHEAIQKLPHARAVYIPSGAQGIPQVYDLEPAGRP